MLHKIEELKRVSKQSLDRANELFDLLKPLMVEKSGISMGSYGDIKNELDMAITNVQWTRNILAVAIQRIGSNGDNS